MKNATYIEILDSYLLPYFPKLRGTSSRQSPYFYQHDNSKVHVAFNVQKWFNEKHVKVLDWPSSSPGLNPIENLWGILQDLLYEKSPILKTSEDVWQESKKIWYNQLNEYIPKLYKSMPFRVEEVLVRKGKRQYM